MDRYILHQVLVEKLNYFNSTTQHMMDFCYKFVHSLLSMSIPKDVWLDVITDCETETSSRYVAGFPPKTDHLQFFTNLYRWEVALRVASQQLTFILAFLSWDCLVTALFLQPLQFNLHPGKFGVYFITEFLQWLFYALYRLKCKLLFARLNLLLFSRKKRSKRYIINVLYN